MMISPEQYIDGLEWRYACKKFDPEARLEQPTWHALAESLRLSPSSLGLQLWKFVVVTNRELKARLREVSWNQSQVEDCSHYVVLCSRRDATRRDVDRYLAQIEFTRRPSAEKLASSADFYTSYVEALAPEKMHAWLDCQVYIALGFLLSAAAALRAPSMMKSWAWTVRRTALWWGWLWATAPRMTLMPARPRCAFPPER